MKKIEEIKKSNFVRIRGTLKYDLKVKYNFKGEDYYGTTIIVPRRAEERYDYIPIIVPERIKKQELCKDSKVYIEGELRKYRNPEDGKSNIMIFALEIILLEEIEKNINEVILEGKIIQPPFYKEMENNRKILNLVLEVYRGNHICTDHLNAYAIDEKAEKAKEFKEYDKIKIVGRIQSRNIDRKNATFYEVFVKRFL